MAAISLLPAGIWDRSLAVPLLPLLQHPSFLILPLPISIACTEAGGLMSAQYQGTIKGAQHATAARNGLLGALLARTGYVGMKKGSGKVIGRFSRHAWSRKWSHSALPYL